MNIDYLKSFYYIATLNNISKASKVLHISQPGLSQQLKKLETEIGHSLLTRTSQGVLLTSIGEVVFEYAKSIFHLESDLHEAIKNLSESKDTLSLAVCKNFGSFYLASRIHSFKELYQEAQITIDTYSSQAVVENVCGHNYNVGIIMFPGLINQLNAKPFFQDQLVLCTHPSYAPDRIDLKTLSTLPLILRENTSNTYQLIKLFIENSILTSMDALSPMFSCNCSNIIKETLLAGTGFSFLPLSSVQSELQSKRIKAIQIENAPCDLLSFQYAFVQRPQYELNYYEKEFKAFLQSLPSIEPF